MIEWLASLVVYSAEKFCPWLFWREEDIEGVLRLEFGEFEEAVDKEPIAC